MSDPLTPRQVASQWFQRVWNERDQNAISELMAADARGLLEGGQEIIGPDRFREFYTAFTSLFPDLRVEVLDIVEEGERVYTRWEAYGTHGGDGMGLKATHQPHSFRGITWMTVKNGQIVDGGDSWNQEGLRARMAAAQ